LKQKLLGIFNKGQSRHRLYLRAAPSSQSPQDIGSVGAIDQVCFE
jgi:hypothetical protein